MTFNKAYATITSSKAKTNMSELAPQQLNNPYEAEAAEFSPAQQAYFNQINQQAGNVQEIADKKESLVDAGVEIIDTFGIEPTLFDSPARSFVFTTIADRWSAISEKADDTEADAEKTFLADSLALLAYEHSPKLNELQAAINGGQEPLQHDEKLKIFDKYTNHDLTVQLQKKINAGFLDDTKQALGINDENEDPYELRVLDIDPDGASSYGITANKEDLERGDFEEHDRIKAQQKLWEDNAVSMKKELEWQHMPYAWVSRSSTGENPVLCINAPLAMKMIDPNITKNTKYYEDEDLIRDTAPLRHEYVHTQGGLDIDGHGFIGINFEELRAEEFSGDKLGYGDIKAFFTDLKMLSGVDVREYMHTQEKGGTSEDVYQEIANHFGLSMTLEIMLASPEPYSAQSPVLKSALDHLGGYDGIMGRIKDNEVALGNEEEMKMRVKARADKLKAMNLDWESVSGHFRSRGLGVGVDMIDDHWRNSD